MAHRPRSAHRQTKLAVVQRHKGVSRAQAAKLARKKAVDFLSESDASAHSTIAPLDTHHGDERDDEDSHGDTEEGDDEDMDVPRVAQWIDDDQEDAISSQGTNDDDEHTESEAEPSRRLVSTSCARLYPLAHARLTEAIPPRWSALGLLHFIVKVTYSTLQTSPPCLSVHSAVPSALSHKHTRSATQSLIQRHPRTRQRTTTRSPIRSNPTKTRTDHQHQRLS